MLSELAFSSKASWGYPAEFLDRVRAELTLAPAALVAQRAHVLEDDGSVQGFFTISGDPPVGELADLFVAPAAMGRGAGTLLFDEATSLAARLGFTRLVIHADPNAEAFYLRRGAVRIGEVPSRSIPSRTLPLLELRVGRSVGGAPPPS